MKPLKGMNMDVSASNMPEGTYRRAQNFIYGKELDSLLQEPGIAEKASHLDGKHVCGAYPLPNDNLLLFAFDQGATNGSGSIIYKYRAATDTYTTVLDDDLLNFGPNTVLKITSFQNSLAETLVVFTDDSNPIRILNIDDPDSDMTTNKLFSEFNLVELRVEQGQGSGGFEQGTHFISVAYEAKDGSRTSFQGLHGPFPIKEGAGTFDVQLSNIDQDYEYLLIASLSFSGDALEAKIQRRFAITDTSIERTIDNINPYDTLTVEELVAKPQVYTRAKTATFYENRLYLGGVREHDEANLQAFANVIQPVWCYGLTGQGGTAHPENLDETYYPDNLRFMPGEVYAFYVSWIRADGSETQAFHIPGFKQTAVPLVIKAADSDLFSTDVTLSVSPDTTINSILSAVTNGAANYLSYDKEAGATHYYQTRDTGTENSTLYNAGDTTVRARGRMGYWENRNETYPLDFPSVKRYEYTGGFIPALNDQAQTLAGELVRHHKFPSLNWLENNTSIAGNYDYNNRPTLSVEFEHVPMPDGYVGVRFYHAKRTVNNSTILGQSLLFHGHDNIYAREAAGNATYIPYVATNGFNTAHMNANPTGQSGANGLTYGQYQSFFTWEVQTYADKGRMHPFDMLRTKPRLSQEEGKHYIRIDQVVGKKAEPHTIGAGAYGTNTDWWLFYVDDTVLNNIVDLYADSIFESTQTRNRLLSFNYNSSLTSFYSVSEQMALRPISDAHYLAAGVIDRTRDIDNRGGEECLFFDIQHSVSNVDMHFPTSSVPSGTTDEIDYWKKKLGYDWTAEARSACTGMFYDDLGSLNSPASGIPQTVGSSRPVSVAPVVNFCVTRTDVYQGYASQDLIACTPVITVLDNSEFTLASSTASTTASKIATDLSVSQVGKVKFDRTFGDMSLSKLRYRTTAFAGWTDKTTNLQPGTSYPQSTTDGASPGIDAGTVRVAHEISLYTAANPYFLDTEQSKEDIYYYLGDNDRPISPSETNDFTLDTSFLKVNDFRQPGIYDHNAEYNSAYPYRVHRSLAQVSDEPNINVRTFLSFDSYEMPRSRGIIQNIESFNDKLLVHHERGLFVTKGKEKLSTTAGEIAFGTGDIFSTIPREIVPTPNGYAGTQHPLSCVMTPAGYFFADASQGKIFQFSEKLQEISNFGMRNFWYEKLTTLNSAAGDSGAIHSYRPGVFAVYDPRWHRVIFHLRNNLYASEASLPTYSFTSNPTDGKGYYNSRYDRDQFVSYNLMLNNWTSFHTYNWTYAVSTENYLYSYNTVSSATDTLQLYEHNDLTQNFGTFFGNIKTARYPSFIDAVLSYKEPVVFSSINWYTKALDHSVLNLGFASHDTTFTSAHIYTDYQCSIDTPLVRTTQASLLNRSANLRKDDYMWKWNGYRDVVVDRTTRFVDGDGELVTSNLDDTKPWYDKKRFVGDAATVRLTYANTINSTIGLYLYEIDAKVRKAYR